MNLNKKVLFGIFLLLVVVTLVVLGCTGQFSKKSKQNTTNNTKAESDNNTSNSNPYQSELENVIVKSGNVNNPTLEIELDEKEQLVLNMLTTNTVTTDEDNELSVKGKQISDFINVVIHIVDETKKEENTKEVKKLSFDKETTDYFHMFPIERKDDQQLSMFFSIVSAIKRAREYGKNAMILYDGYQFHDSNEELYEKLQYIHEHFGKNWSVIALDQHVEQWQEVYDENKKLNVIKLLKCEGFGGFIINKMYISRLLTTLINYIRYYLNKYPMKKMNKREGISHVLNTLKEDDMWIGFTTAVGSMKDQTPWNIGETHSKPMSNPFRRQHVLFYTIKDNVKPNSDPFLQQFISKLLPGHNVHFLIFDRKFQIKDYNTDINIHVFKLDNTDTMSKYLQLVELQKVVKNFEFIFFIDSNYQILHPVSKKDILPNNGLIAVGNQIEGKHGSQVTYSEKFHGGKRKLYMDLCTFMMKVFIENDKNEVTNDEYSLLNKYLETKSGSIKMLDLSFMYDKKCIDPACKDPSCKALYGIIPKMVI